MAQTGIMEIDTQSAYAQSFGNLKHLTRYSDASNNVDLRARDNFLGQAYSAGLKALDVANASAGTTDKAIIPIYLDPQIIDRTRHFTPLVEIIPRVSNMGITAEYSYLTKGSAYSALEDAALPEVNDTYTRVSVAIKYLYAVGRVTGQALAATPSFMLSGITASGSGNGDGSFGQAQAPNAMQLEVLAKTRELKELEENMIINGYVTTTACGTGAPDGTEYNGIIRQMSTTNAVVKSTTALGLDDLNTAIQYAFDDGGRPNLAVCSSSVFGDILNLVQNKLGYLNSEAKVFWGMTSVTYRSMVGEIPIIPSMFMSNVSGSKAIYFLDLSVCEMRVLQDMTYEPLAKTNDSQKFLLKIYEAFIIKNPNFCSSVTGILA